MCDDLGINLSFFSQIMWGHRSSEDVCIAVASYLDIPLELIYDGPLKRGRPRKLSLSDTGCHNLESE